MQCLFCCFALVDVVVVGDGALVDRTGLWVVVREEGSSEALVCELQGHPGHPGCVFVLRAKLALPSDVDVVLLDGPFVVALQETGPRPRSVMVCACWALLPPAEEDPHSTAYDVQKAADVVGTFASAILDVKEHLRQPWNVCRACSFELPGGTFGVAVFVPQRIPPQQQQQQQKEESCVRVVPGAVWVVEQCEAGRARVLREVDCCSVWDSADWRWCVPYELLWHNVVVLQPLWDGGRAVVPDRVRGLRALPPTSVLVVHGDGSVTVLRCGMPVAGAQDGTTKGLEDTLLVRCLDDESALLVASSAGSAAVVSTSSPCCRVVTSEREWQLLLMRSAQCVPAELMLLVQQQTNSLAAKAAGAVPPGVVAPFEECAAEAKQAIAQLVQQCSAQQERLGDAVSSAVPRAQAQSTHSSGDARVVRVTYGSQQRAVVVPVSMVLAPGVVARCTDGAARTTWVVDVAAAEAVPEEGWDAVCAMLCRAVGAERASADAQTSRSRLLALQSVLSKALQQHAHLEEDNGDGEDAKETVLECLVEATALCSTEPRRAAQ